MKLIRPLAVIDLETTGPDVTTARIVDIAIITRFPDGTLVEWSALVNPGMPIPPAATAVHGITDSMVADAPRFGAIAADVSSLLAGCDIGGFNVIRFDRPLLRAELERASMTLPPCDVVDAFTIFRANEPRDLTAAVSFYLGRTHDAAHRALADAVATLQVFEAQVVKYQMPEDISAIAEACKPPVPENAIDAEGKLVWVEGHGLTLPCVNFGEHKGHSLQWLAKRNQRFLKWILAKDFSAEVKAIVREALAGRFPSKEVSRAA